MQLKTTIRLSSITLPLGLPAMSGTGKRPEQAANRPAIPRMHFGKYLDKPFNEIPEPYLHNILQSSEELVAQIRCYLGLPTTKTTVDEFKRAVWREAEQWRKDPCIAPELKTEVLKCLQGMLSQLPTL